MNDKEILEKISTYIDGELNEDERIMVEKTLSENPEFKEYAENIKFCGTLLKNGLEEISRDIDFNVVWNGIKEKGFETSEEKFSEKIVNYFKQIFEFLKDSFLLKKVPQAIGAYGFAFVLIAFFMLFFTVFQKSSSMECYIYSYTVKKGTVVIDSDLTDKETPLVIWHFEEEES